jgi:hypothetical protein
MNGIQKFSAIALPCSTCGLAVNSPEATTHTLESVAQIKTVGPGEGVPILIEGPAEYLMATCPRCAASHELAERIIDAHPAWAAARGERWYGLNLIRAALVALDVVGGVQEGFVKQFLLGKERHFQMVIEFLDLLGAGARYSSRFIPVTKLVANPARLSSERFDFLTAEERQRLSAAFVSLLFALRDKEGFVPPPDGRGCLLCGVGHVWALASKSREIWGDPWQAVPATLGGKGQPDPIVGFLCPACGSVAERHRALGMAVLEESFIEFLAVDRGGIPLGNDVRIDGLRAWCTLPEGTPPNRTPWAHEPDHEQMARALRIV